MESSPRTSRRFKKSQYDGQAPVKDEPADIYSTVVIHDDVGASDEGSKFRSSKFGESEDIYATMVYKEEQEDSSLPPLLQRLPKDFGAVHDDDDDDEDMFSTFVVKSNEPSSSSSGLYFSGGSRGPSSTRYFGGSPAVRSPRRESPRVASAAANDDAYSTMIFKDDFYSTMMKEDDVYSTMINKDEDTFSTVIHWSGEGASPMSDISKAVESMRQSGNHEKKGTDTNRAGNGKLHEAKKRSTSPVPDDVIREDPSTKYELLDELGMFFDFLFSYIYQKF